LQVSFFKTSGFAIQQGSKDIERSEMEMTYWSVYEIGYVEKREVESVEKAAQLIVLAQQ
jgi:hypothetical protein